MSSYTLKQLQSEVETLITKSTDHKYALAKENNKRTEYITQLETELREQQQLMHSYNESIKVCKKNVNDLSSNHTSHTQILTFNRNGTIITLLIFKSYQRQSRFNSITSDLQVAISH